MSIYIFYDGTLSLTEMGTSEGMTLGVAAWFRHGSLPQEDLWDQEIRIVLSLVRWSFDYRYLPSNRKNYLKIKKKHFFFFLHQHWARNQEVIEALFFLSARVM